MSMKLIIDVSENKVGMSINFTTTQQAPTEGEFAYADAISEAIKESLPQIAAGLGDEPGTFVTGKS